MEVPENNMSRRGGWDGRREGRLDEVRSKFFFCGGKW
jgi:hypothetical protein